MALDAIELLTLLAVGLAAGTLGGLLGIGGSVIMIPAMAFLFHTRPWDSQHLYQAAAMVVNVVVAAPAARRHRRANAVPMGFVRFFLPAVMVFMIVGVLLSNLFAGEALRRVFGVFLLYVVGNTLWAILRRRHDHPLHHARIDPTRSLSIGAATGTVGGLLGIGGGIVSVPLAQIVCHLPLRSAIAASATAMVYSSTLGAALKLGTLDRHGDDWRRALLIAAALAPTALLGGHLGAGLTHRAPVNVMRIILAAVLLVMAARMFGWL